MHPLCKVPDFIYIFKKNVRRGLLRSGSLTEIWIRYFSRCSRNLQVLIFNSYVETYLCPQCFKYFHDSIYGRTIGAAFQL